MKYDVSHRDGDTARGRPTEDAYHPNIHNLLFRTNVNISLPYYSVPAQLNAPKENPFVLEGFLPSKGHLDKWKKDELGEWTQDRWSVARELDLAEDAERNQNKQILSLKQPQTEKAKEKRGDHARAGEGGLIEREGYLKERDTAAHSATLRRLGLSKDKLGRMTTALPQDRRQANASKLHHSTGAVAQREYERRAQFDLKNPSMALGGKTFRQGRFTSWPAMNSTARDVGSLGSILSEGHQITGDHAYESAYHLSRDKHTPHPVHCLYGKREQGLTSRTMGKFQKKLRDMLPPHTYNNVTHTRLRESTVMMDAVARTTGPLRGRVGRSFGASPLFPGDCMHTFATKSYNSTKESWL